MEQVRFAQGPFRPVHFAWSISPGVHLARGPFPPGPCRPGSVSPAVRFSRGPYRPALPAGQGGQPSGRSARFQVPPKPHALRPKV